MATRRRMRGAGKFKLKTIARLVRPLKRAHARAKALRPDECAICMEPISNPSYTLPCTHRFHRHCLNDWMTRDHTTCPTCRSDLPPDLVARIRLPRARAVEDGSWNHLPPGFTATPIYAPRGPERSWGGEDPRGPAGWRNTGIRITGPTANDRNAPYGPHRINANCDYFYMRDGVSNRYKVFERRRPV